MKLRYHPDARAELRAAMSLPALRSQVASDSLTARGETSGHSQNTTLVVYTIVPDQIVVLAIAHTRQPPGYWRDRLCELG